MSYIPTRCFTKTMLYYICSLNKSLTIPEHYDYGYYDAYQINLSGIPSHMFNDIKLCTALISITSQTFKYMPKSLLTVDFCIQLLQTPDDYHRLIHSIPKYITSCKYFAHTIKSLYPQWVYLTNSNIIYETRYDPHDDCDYDIL